MKGVRMFKKISTRRLNTCLVTVLSLGLFISTEAQAQNKNPNLLLSLDFNKQDNYSPSGTQINYGKGIEGSALVSGNGSPVPAINRTNPAWFSNDRDFSISVWVRSNDQSRDTTIIVSNSDFMKKPAGIYGSRPIGKGFTLYCRQGGWGWNIGNGLLHYLYEPMAEDQPLADNEWHHLVFTHNASQKEIRLFYDGINKAVLHIGDLDDSNFLSDLSLRIGSDETISPGHASFRGLIDKLQVWKYTLSPQQVKKEFEQYATVVVEPEFKKDVLTVVNWNIWHGGTHFTKEEDGFDGIERIIALIKNAGADIVLMQETYGAGSRISSSLGFYYYEAASTIGAVWGANLSVMSRFPIEDAYMAEERSNYGNNYAFNNGGVMIKLSENKRVIASSNWYNGKKPEDLAGALKAWKGLIEQADEIPIIYGGDYNSVSHLDDGQGASGHSKLMTNAGFIDSYRHLHPDPVSHPGYTAGRFEDRIDYIYFKGKDLKLIDAGPIVPNFRGKEERTPGYPSDHLGLVAKFKFK